MTSPTFLTSATHIRIQPLGGLGLQKVSVGVHIQSITGSKPFRSSQIGKPKTTKAEKSARGHPAYTTEAEPIACTPARPALLAPHHLTSFHQPQSDLKPVEELSEICHSFNFFSPTVNNSLLLLVNDKLEN